MEENKDMDGGGEVIETKPPTKKVTLFDYEKAQDVVAEVDDSA